MKIRLPRFLASLVLFAASASSLSAVETEISASDAEVSSYYGISVFTFNYTQGHGDLLLNRNLRFGGNSIVTVNWGDSEDDDFTLSGKGALTSMLTTWTLGSGTYTFAQTGNGKYAITSQDLISYPPDSTTVILDSAARYTGITGVDNLVINNEKVKIDSILSVGTIESEYELSSKQIQFLIGGAWEIDANILLNGGYMGMNLGALAEYIAGEEFGIPMYLSGSCITDVSGNVTFKGKNTYYCLIEPPPGCSYEESWDDEGYGEGYYEPSGGNLSWAKKPNESQIKAALSELDGEPLMTCYSFTGSVASMGLELCYILETDWEIREGYIKCSKYGTCVPLYEPLGGEFDIVFKMYDNAVPIADDLKNCGERTWGSNDLYLQKSVSLSSSGYGKFGWNGDDESFALLGKGVISAKGGIEVSLKNGNFTLAEGCSFKDADYKLEDACLITSGVVSANSVDLKDWSLLHAGNGAVTVKGNVSMNDSEMYSSSNVTVKGNVSMNNSAMSSSSNVTVKEELDMKDESYLSLSGKLNVGRMEMEGDSNLFLLSEKPQTIALTQAKDVNKNEVVNSLSDSFVGAIASMTVAGSLEMTDSCIILGDVADKPKPMGLTVKGSLAISAEEKDDAAELDITGKLSAGSLVMTNADIYLANEKAQSITLTLAKDAAKQVVTNRMTNSTIVATGSMTVAGSLDISDSCIMLLDASAKPKPMGLTVKGSVSLHGVFDWESDWESDWMDKALYLTGKLSAGSLSMTDASILLENIAAPQSITLTLAKDAAKQVVTNRMTNSTIAANGSMTVAGNLDMKDGSHLHLWDASTKPKAMGLTVKGDLRMNIPAEGETGSYAESGITLTGKLSAGSLVMSNADIYLANEKAQSIALTQAKDASKNEVTNMLTNSRINANGSMTVAGNLHVLGSSSIHLWDASSKPKAMGLTVKGNLLLDGGGITLSGALSAKNLKVEGDSTITMNSSKVQTIKVGNAFTVKQGVTLTLNLDSVSDIKVGKTYNLITYKSGEFNGNDDLYEMLGLDDSKNYCTLKDTGKAITLSVSQAQWDAWKSEHEQEPSLVEYSLESPCAVAAVAAVAAPAEQVEQEETDADEPKAVALATNIQTVLDYTPVADALVQANWGLVETSRAFVNTIANRSMAVQLGSGERAVWASAIGGSSRRSSNAGHYGADTSITGGALGMETQLGENSLLGAALGNSWTRVSAHGFGKIKQDTTHFGLYGQTNWGVLSADWSAAYGRSESRSNGSSWNQQSIQLDARLSYNHALTDNTLLRGFAGAQYYGHDSATVDGIETGDVQNLRAEVGVGIVRYTEKSSVYAEISLLQDVARHNPEVRIPDGQRYRGLNPGRTGVNITVGGSYALSSQWSLNASYTAEIVENATSHSINAGATYKF